MTKTAIVGATLIDGTGRPPVPDSTVLIDGDRVVAAGPSVFTPVADDVEIVDAHDAYVIPGLQDANVHLVFDILPERLIREEGRYHLLVEEAAQIALAAGVTTVYDTWGPAEALSVARDRIASGEVEGSRIYFAGNIIGLDGPLSDDFLSAGTVLGTDTTNRINAHWELEVGSDLAWEDVDTVRKRVRAYIEKHSPDQIKYAGSGHSKMHFILFSERVQRAIVEEAHRAGLTVQAHTTTLESLRMEIDAGADLLQHPDVSGTIPIPPMMIQEIAERRIPCAVMPLTETRLAYNDSDVPEPLKSLNRVKELNDRALIAAGATLLLTTDGGVASNALKTFAGPTLQGPDVSTALGEGHFLWLEAMSAKGLEPMACLQAATSNVARAYGREESVGTLEPGRLADLVILARDPLADPRNYRSIRMVMKGGNALNLGGLPRHRIATSD